MANKTAIQWTNFTLNSVTGCTKVSPGCDHCYAEGTTKRFKNHFPNGFELTLHPERLPQIERMRTSQMIFMNSMSDLFHKGVPDSHINQVFDTMDRVDQHIYQCLTKRSSRQRNYVNERYGDEGCPPHIWLGVSIESTEQLGRLRHLQETNAAVRMVSFEPLLGPINDVCVAGVHWAIVGGESGIGHRPIEVTWVRSLRDQCQVQNVPFFFKQWGGRTSNANGNELDGRQWSEYPPYHAKWLEEQALRR